MNFHKKLLGYVLMTTCMCLNAHAMNNSHAIYGSSNKASNYISSHLVTSISMGPVWSNGGEAQTLTLMPNIVKTYTADKPSQTLTDGEFFIGVNQLLPQDLQVQFGLAFAATSKAGLTGNIWDDALPEFNNYNYHYQLAHSHIALKAKLLIDRGYFIMPWISVSAGVGFNRASNFSNTPTSEEAIVTPNFASNTATSFTYTLGVGIQHQFDSHWQAGIGYEFADWGRSHLDAAPGQTTSEGLSLSHFYTRGILANLTYSA